MLDDPQSQLVDTASKNIACAPNFCAAITDESKRSDIDFDQALDRVADTLQKAATLHYGADYDIRVTLSEDGSALTAQILTVVEQVTDQTRQVSQQNAHRHKMNVRLEGEIINFLPTYIPDALLPMVQGSASFSIKNIRLIEAEPAQLCRST